jgi:hypothetical protein
VQPDVLGQVERVLADPGFHRVGIPGLQRLDNAGVVDLGMGQAVVVADGTVPYRPVARSAAIRAAMTSSPADARITSMIFSLVFLAT